MNHNPRLHREPPLWVQVLMILIIGLGECAVLYGWVDPIMP